jgi:hypothetical protein
VPSDRENSTRLSPIVLPIRGSYFGVILDLNSTSSKASGSGQGSQLEAIARLSGQGSGVRVGRGIGSSLIYCTGSGLVGSPARGGVPVGSGSVGWLGGYLIVKG